jgi:hypothetical protein
MTERELLLEQIALNRQLVWLAIILFILMLGKEALLIGRIIRRHLGFKANGDALDDVTYGQFTKHMAVARSQANQRTMWAVSQINAKLSQRMNAVDKQLKLVQRKDRIMLIILRDIRAFMIYGRRPTSDLPPIELDEDDTPTDETPDPTFPEEIDKTEEDREQP